MSPLPNAIIAAVYARKSTEQSVPDEQRSVARQVDGARAYASTKGWIVSEDHVYIDDGISGAEFATRPGFLRLMNAVSGRQPPFSVLIMSEESRLGREAIETAYALKRVVTAGVRVFFYLEDRERTIETATDKLMMSVSAFTDEVERERARQRTTDAMRRKADAGHVTGGRVFGYENHTVIVPGGNGQLVRSHVERRVKESEAATVRRIFDLCAAGNGFKRIAKLLNGEGAPAPRPQRQRPRGWAPSSVGEILYRPLYRGEIVWNKTKKRDAWGQRKYVRRPQAEWITVPAQHLRIVSEEQWAAAHERLQSSRQSYLRHTNGRVWGRPANGVESKYLLTGLAICGACGAGMLTRSRKANRQRTFFYGCAANYLRGEDVCRNGLEIPMAMADGAVLEMVERSILTPAVIEKPSSGCSHWSSSHRRTMPSALRTCAATSSGWRPKSSDSRMALPRLERRAPSLPR